MNAIELEIAPRRRSAGNSTVDRLLPYRERRMVGPFIFCDHVGPEHHAPGSGVDVDAHPHIGLSTLSYLRRGRLVHRDSLGTVQPIDVHDVNWMTAGSGITHTERTGAPERVTGQLLHLLQLWVALPDGEQDGPPRFDHRAASTLPHEDVPNATVRLIAGQGFGLSSAVPVSSPLLLAELQLGAEADVALDNTYRERAVLALDGRVFVGDQLLPTGHLAVIGDVDVGLRGPGTALVLGGDPVGTRHIWWNFVHSDLAQIEEAKQRWDEQRFPKVPGDHDPWVPLPR